jgi:hypothetical protein
MNRSNGRIYISKIVLKLIRRKNILNLSVLKGIPFDKSAYIELRQENGQRQIRFFEVDKCI